ncbi:MAG: FxsA family protein [Pseudomonadota bacterium]
MPIGLLIPLALLIVPILEIAVFIVIGGQIGVLATLGMVLLTAVIGTILLRIQGFSLVNRIRTELQADRIPGRDLAHGAMLVAAGLLLLTPGFVTDALGFLLFVPPVRDGLFAFLAARMSHTIVVRPDAAATGGRPTGNRPPSDDVVDLDPEDFERRPDPASPWNKDDRS